MAKPKKRKKRKTKHVRRNLRKKTARIDMIRGYSDPEIKAKEIKEIAEALRAHRIRIGWSDYLKRVT